MIDTDPEYHIRKGMMQARAEISKQLPPPIEELPDPLREAPLVERLSQSSLLLGKGIVAGSFFGSFVGCILAIRAKQTSLILPTTIQFGLLGGQFVGFRYMLPQGIHKYLGDEIFNLPGLTLPVEDFSEREKEVGYSALAGGISGYILSRLKAVEHSTQIGVSNAFSHSVGLRSGLVWAMLFGLGHYLYFKADDLRKNYVIDSRLRQIYGPHRTLKLEEGEVPRELVVKSTWDELLRDPARIFYEYNISLPSWLPLIHEKEAYEYRLYLESKSMLLEAEYRQLLKEKRQRDRLIRELRGE